MSVVLIFTVNCSALNWVGDSTGGGGGGTSAGAKGYALASTGSDNCIGYRFSVVDSSGNTIGYCVDVFRSGNTNADYEYLNGYCFSEKRNKKQLINNQNSSFETSRNMSLCLYETELGFSSVLPNPDGMKNWQNSLSNINEILDILGIGNVDGLAKGDKILVEPLYSIRLESVWHFVTVTEAAIYGKYILGAENDGGSSSNSGSWGFISEYTNKHYPNALYTPDGMGLWNGASSLSSRATFNTVINDGYGVGIAYAEKRDRFIPNLDVESVFVYSGKNIGSGTVLGNSTSGDKSGYLYYSGYPICGMNIYFKVVFGTEENNVPIKQTIYLDGKKVNERTGNCNDLKYYSFAPDPVSVPNTKEYYVVSAVEDFIDENGNVKRAGKLRSFYVPIRPEIIASRVNAVNIKGDIQAYCDNTTKTGAIYLGQRIVSNYLFTTTAQWNAQSNLSAEVYSWSGGWTKYPTTNSYDGLKTNAIITNKYPVRLTSRLGYLTVPDNSESGKYVYRYRMYSQWIEDTEHTGSAKWYNIDVLVPDLELKSIRLVNKEGYYADTDNLIPGEEYTIRYVYKNNTDCIVFADGYGNNGLKINSDDKIFEIKPNSTIEIVGEKIKAPQKGTMDVWGGVYLESVSFGDVSYELNGTNNEKILKCTVCDNLKISPISQPSPYREKTEVITSYWFENLGGDDVLPGDGISAEFIVKTTYGQNIGIFKQDDLCVPGKESNLVYFKWMVPEGLDFSNITITAKLLRNGNVISSAEKTYITIPYSMYQVEDTEFEKQAPNGFCVPNVPNEENKYAVWWEYSYENGAFNKNTYCLVISNNSYGMVQVATDPNSEIGNYNMKSGYGIYLDSIFSVNGVYGYTVPKSYMYTLSQYRYALLPEYSYTYGKDKCITLEKISSTVFSLPNFNNYGRVHFTPIYYPNTNYTVMTVFTDVWTPAGVIYKKTLCDSIKIDGSAYDDWFIGRRV